MAYIPKVVFRMVENSLSAYGFELNANTKDIFTKYRKTHNEGVFSAYTDEMLACRRSAIITGLPMPMAAAVSLAIIRRVALYGTENLIAEKLDYIKFLIFKNLMKM